jgi:Mce-associated membrane protein
VEDQPADPGDLTADAATASIPQGKAARNRHRLPRQRTQPGQPADGDETSQAGGAEETPETEETGDTEDSAAAPEFSDAAEAAEDEEPAAAPSPKPRRRMPWRRHRTATGAVTSDAAEPVVEPATEPVAEPQVTGVEPQLTGDEPQVTAVEPQVTDDDLGEPVEDGDETDRVLVPHRPAGRALKTVAVAASVAFVAAAAFAGASIAPYLTDRAAVQTKFAIAETAADAITTLWTYTPEDMDKLPDRSARYLGGDFASDYKRYIDAIVAPNKQAQVSNNTQVLGAAVESLTPTEATAIVYTNSVATSPVTKGIPSLRYLSYRLTMKRQDNRWLITQMVAVTKLDLTPRL